jgi:hypothetical protein
MNVKEYFSKCGVVQRELFLELKKIIFGVYPNSSEEMKWGVPAYVEGEVYLVGLKDFVNIGFSLKHLPKEFHAILKTGKETGSLKIKSKKDINKKQIIEILKSLK